MIDKDQCTVPDIGGTSPSTQDRHSTPSNSSPRTVTRPPWKRAPQRSQPLSIAASTNDTSR